MIQHNYITVDYVTASENHPKLYTFKGVKKQQLRYKSYKLAKKI
jgi:hypothetical protein